jgi:hypothetical protein
VPELAAAAGVTTIVSAAKNLAAIAATPIQMKSQSTEGSSEEKKQNTSIENKDPAPREQAKSAFNREAGNHPRKIIRERPGGTSNRIKGVGAGNATYRPKGNGRYSVTPQSGNKKKVEHF